MEERARIKRLLDVAAGRQRADLCITGAHVVDVYNGEVNDCDVLVADGHFAGFGGDGFPVAHTVVDAHGAYMTPGFVDSHVHIESSHCSPPEFCRLVVPRGTTTVIADPHEICNVCGLAGLDYMLASSENLPLSVFLMIPSCVPATPFENAGATMLADTISQRMDQQRVLGLGELMNYVGVVAADDAILDKLMVARKSHKRVDGHSPSLQGASLDAYAASGVLTDHECETPQDLHERIRRGMYVLLREGSACRNVSALLAGVTDRNQRRCLFCTDDRQPKSILEEGHINNNMRLAVAGGLDPINALCMATINACECYGLRDRGAIAPGMKADFCLLDNLQDFQAIDVYVDGQHVAHEGNYLLPVPHYEPKGVSGKMQVSNFSESRLHLPLSSTTANVIEIIPGGVVTKLSQQPVHVRDGVWVHDPSVDVLKLAVVERHHGTGNVGVALISGYGLQGGAIGMSIAHDSHNIIVVGDNDHDMAVAVQALVAMGGGIVMAKDGKVLDSLCLPIAGLMTDETAMSVDQSLSRMHQVAVKQLHVNTDVDPFMTLCFMALPVIPAVKLTDEGLFDVTTFSFIPVSCGS